MRSAQLARLGVFACAAAAAIGCGATSRIPVTTGFDPNPSLPKPDSSLIPVVNVVDAKGWTSGMSPVAGSGTTVNAFASGLDHPRWLYVLPNGDVLVAETKAPPRQDDGNGNKGWIFKQY